MVRYDNKNRHAYGPSEEQHSTIWDRVCQEILNYFLRPVLCPWQAVLWVLVRELGAAAGWCCRGVGGIELAQCTVPPCAQHSCPVGFEVLSCNRNKASIKTSEVCCFEVVMNHKYLEQEGVLSPFPKNLIQL